MNPRQAAVDLLTQGVRLASLFEHIAAVVIVERDRQLTFEPLRSVHIAPMKEPQQQAGAGMNLAL